MSREFSNVSFPGGGYDSKADDANHTVVFSSVAETSMGGKTGHHQSTVVGGSGQEKHEVEDFIGGMNISPYISSELDVSSDLVSPLEEVNEKYALLDAIGKGGTATVYVARDRNLRRLVAVKSLRQGVKDYSMYLKFFVAEAKVTAQLDHPGIIPIHGLAHDDKGGVYLIMKLVNGKTLHDYLRNLSMNYRMRGVDAFDEDMELRKRLELFLRVLDTIKYAHHRRVIHRDLKPENIMIGEFMEVFVMDWGLAKVLPPPGSPPEPPEPLSGTTRYFPPEVLAGTRNDPRSDIFTLGLILQEIVTLQHAFNGTDDKEILANIRSGNLAPIEHLYHRKIDKYLRAIIQKATAYSLDERYQDVGDLAEDLRRYMGGLSISIKPDTMWDWLRRKFFGRRN